ncbi:hypothetical protein [Kineosporia babensis]|uniref:Uncharacterized protein n=1 Tax=Kineosporia babensis TaxID=499548 RepID=A0A9X1NBL9_9ACTN|nr:hypothetical protein [Kineosporia babensis]MCD5311120.1 hypothetical protein [Kineosporia babensis]
MAAAQSSQDGRSTGADVGRRDGALSYFADAQAQVALGKCEIAEQDVNAGDAAAAELIEATTTLKSLRDNVVRALEARC